MKITTNVMTVDELLNDPKTYVVPVFQRGYAWEKSHIEDFWNDINRIYLNSNNDDSHFLGAMVFTSGEAENRIKILDGQQRLATIALFLSALRDVLQLSGIERAPEWVEQIKTKVYTTKIATLEKRAKLELNRDDKIYFSKILLEGIVPNPSKESHRLIKAAYSYLKEMISKEIVANKDRFVSGILEALTEKLLLIRIEVDSDSNAHMIFETLNDRGLDLSVADLVKNYIFLISGGNLESHITQWKEIVDQIGDYNVTKFLRHFWISNYEFVRKEELYKKIKASIHIKNVDKFIENLSIQATIYSNLNNPTHEFWGNNAIEELITNLNTLRAEQVSSILMAAYCRYHDTSMNEFKKALEILVNFTFRYSTICGLNPNDLEPIYSELSRKIRNGEIDIKGLNDSLKHKAPTVETFKGSFSSLEIKNSKLAKYILIKVNNFLLKKDGKEELLLNEKQINLEHIIPKNPDKEWVDYFKGNNIDPEFLVNKIGNMTVLLEEYNRKIANKYFTKKKEMYKKSVLPLNIELSKFSEFGEKEIIIRQNNLASLALEIWPFN